MRRWVRTAYCASLAVLLGGCGLFGTESGNPSADRGATNVPASGAAGLGGAFGNAGMTPQQNPGMPAGGNAGTASPPTATPCVPNDSDGVVSATCVADAGMAHADDDAGVPDDDGGMDDVLDASVR